VCCGQIVSGIVGYDSCPRDTVERLMELRGRTDADE
jgi:hypothetical protein